MKHPSLHLLSLLTGLTGILCNGGEHHGDHGHHHHHGGGVPATEELTDLIQNFGLAVLGKDQESANDIQPTADHSHINVKALINELFHPSTTSTSTTTTPRTTSTQRLPIKSHDLGWELSPIDLVMSNSILKPVFSPEQLERQSRMLRPVYLTETPYLKSDEDQFVENQLRSGKSLGLDSLNLDPEQLIDKPTLPVLDTRRANFLLVNGGKRSKTGRRKKISKNKGDDVKKTSKKHQHGDDDEDDVLWRETVWSLKFRQTSPHPEIDSESTTNTPLSDLSPFLQPPARDVSSPARRPNEKALATNASSRKPSQFSGPARLKGGKSSGKNVEDHERNPEQPDTDSRHLKHGQNTRPQQVRGTTTSRRRKSNDDGSEDIFDDKAGDIILHDDQLDSSHPHTGPVNHNLRPSQVKPVKTVPRKKNAVRRGKKVESQQRRSKQNLVDNKRQGESDEQQMLRSSTVTKSKFECQHKSEGLHPDIQSGCQRFYMCHENGRSGRFTCPVGTLFSHQLGVCDWAKKVDCGASF